MSANEWKLVPVQPTADMRNAYHAVTDDEITTKGAAGSRWAAMLAAAPTAPAQAASGGEVVAWRTLAAEWLRRKAEAARPAAAATGWANPAHALPHTLERLAMELDADQEQAPFGLEPWEATPASAPPAGDPPAPAAAREVVEALRELLACHTESAGFTMSMAASTEDFAAFMDRQQARIDAAVAQARAALAAADAQRAQEGGK